MREFIKDEKVVLFFVGLCLGLFALTFYLFNLPWSIFIVTMSLILVILLCHLAWQGLYFQKQKSKAQELLELQQAYLELKNKSLMNQNDLEDYFLLWVHQIKTPIAASQILLEGSDHPDRFVLTQELVKIEAYTKLALNYLKVINPKKDMVFSRVAIDDLIRPLLKSYRHQFIHDNIQLHYQPFDDEVLTEANLCQILIEQVLSNALKYAKGGQIWIKWDSAQLLLSIEDDGPGIAQEDLPKIFERGYAGHNGLLNQHSSGIGLYMVQLIANRLNQRVHVTSKEGSGTCFTLQFNHDQT